MMGKLACVQRSKQDSQGLCCGEFHLLKGRIQKCHGIDSCSGWKVRMLYSFPSYIKEEVLTKFAPLLDWVSPKQSL